MVSVMRVCTAYKCETQVGKHGARGWCPKHYKRWKATGDPEEVTRVPRGSSNVERLFFYGWDVSTSGCWLYNGGLDPDGYGHFSTRGLKSNGNLVSHRAHRVAYEEWIGPIPEGMIIRHSCDTPRCINPLHLLAGTPAQNSQDAVDRKRMANGERHGCHILTDEQVNAIRDMYATSKISQRSLAKQFHCSQAQISNILLYKQRVNGTWILAEKTLLTDNSQEIVIQL